MTQSPENFDNNFDLTFGYEVEPAPVDIDMGTAEIAQTPEGWGLNEWHAEVARLEGERDMLIADAEKAGKNPLEDTAIQFVLGQLDIANTQLISAAGRQITKDL